MLSTETKIRSKLQIRERVKLSNKEAISFERSCSLLMLCSSNAAHSNAARLCAFGILVKISAMHSVPILKSACLIFVPAVVLWMRAPERVTRVRVASTASAHLRTWPCGPVRMLAPVYH